MSKGTFTRRLLPFILIAVFAVIIGGLYVAKPKPKRDFSRPEARILVDVETLKTTDFDPLVESYGVVEPLIQSQVTAQVGGMVIEVSETFRDGGFFSKGDALLRIDPADYKIEQAIASAKLAEAQRNLEEQKALAEQARQDWQRLGDAKPPSALTLREPQVAAAKANVVSAQASVERAKLNLQRTEIRAPFDGRVLSKQVDLGQVINSNTVLGNIYATNAVEVRLPIKNQDLSLLALPERYRHQSTSIEALPNVSIISQLTKEETWEGRIVRTASAVDSTNRQLYVVARIDDPFGEKAEGRFPLKIGQYVNAHINGKTIKDTIVIPISSIYQGSYVYVNRGSAVYRQEVDILWQNSEQAVIQKGLSIGDQLVLSPLGQVASGTRIKITGDESTSDRSSKKSQPKRQVGEQPPTDANEQSRKGAVQ